MKNTIKTFLKDEDGAVTVDWVVLTAAVAAMAIAAVSTVEVGVSSLATDIEQHLQSQSVD